MIGDCETAALVHRSGSIDWLCWPRFDSEACFSALLGTPEHGRWLVTAEACIRRRRRYRHDTLILETTIEAETGSCDIIDFMPMRGSSSDLVRIVIGREGHVGIESNLALRFDYGRLIPWVKRVSDDAFEAVSGPHAVTLRAPGQTELEGGALATRLDIAAGQHRAFVLTYRSSHLSHPPKLDPYKALDETEHIWRDWISRCTFEGPRQDAVRRSLITVKALTYNPTGGLVAAPTTSLPERIGGERNWDYRFCWLRDASLTLRTLVRAGYQSEAGSWRDWLLRAAAGMPDALQPIYGIAGEHRIEEQEIPWLPGFCGSSPVRVGNLAHRQMQIDVFGELLDAMHLARKNGLPPDEASWQLQFALVGRLESCWIDDDRGIWEVRSGGEQFTHSKIMAWVAFDRAIRAAERLSLDAPLERWRAIRTRIRDAVLERGYNAELGTFVRVFDGDQPDASLLLAPMSGFISANDHRMKGTLLAIENALLRDGFVFRYDTSTVADGLQPGEGAFLACSLWFADNLIMQGRVKEARAVFERVLETANDVGLLSEEYDPQRRLQLGNFPQALSHIALIDTAYRLADASASAASGPGVQADRQ